MCLVVISAALTTSSRRLQVLLQSFHVIHVDDHTDRRLAGKHKKALNQRFGGLAAYVDLISFVTFLHLFVPEAFHLFVRKLDAERRYCFAGGYKHSQLLYTGLT